MTNQEPEQAEVIAALREQTSELVEQLSGQLSKVSVSSGDATVTVEWAQPDAAPAAPDGSPPAATEPGPATPAAPEDTGHIPVTAPLVGTFYRAPRPGAQPFVEVGSAVDADQTVGIVEAMKLMNPVKAAQAGTVAAIHADDGEMVEFGQPLLDLAPAQAQT